VKIAVVGCGALGSFYGAKLCRVGQEVHFLLRSDFEVVRRAGVHIQSIEGDFHVRPICADRPDAIGVADLVLIGLKTTANREFSRLLPPLVGPNTAIVTLQNGLGNEEHLAALFDPAAILCGLCFVCLNRLAPGVVRHTAHGRVVLGEFHRPAGERTRALAQIFTDAAVPCQLTENSQRAHWEKLIWNIPFNGLGVAGVVGYEAVIRGAVVPPARMGPCLPTDQLLGDPRWASLVRELMEEVVSSAGALGFTLPEKSADTNIERTRLMGAYKASTLLDYERGQPLELESMFLEPLRRAREAGVEPPRLAALCEVLRQLNPE
jgi:2-dehydropantoate 2-reductase